MDVLNDQHLSQLELSKFDISPERGFLGTVLPLQQLPGQYFAKWEELLAQLPSYIKRGTLREAIHQLPELEFSNVTLKSVEEWKRAYLLLGFLGQGYIWMEGEAGIVDQVPKKIAVPWFSVSRRLGTQPIGTYAIFVLQNYGVHDGKLPWTMDNLYAQHTFTDTKDESHFYLIHVLMELAASPAITAVAAIYDNMHNKDNGGVMKCLKTIQGSIMKIGEVVSRMYEGCNQKVFFVDIRLFFAAIPEDEFPNGLVYEGVDNDLPKTFHGASGAQSSVLYMLNNFLGISLSGKSMKFVQSMMNYMPPGHREFLAKVKDMPSTRDYCKQSENVELVAPFNEVVRELVKFRGQHIILVTSYVINQKENSVLHYLDEKGTGGSDAIQFLKSVREATAAREIKMSD